MPKRAETKEQLYKELQKLSWRANKRIASVEKSYGKESWAIKKLRNRLDIPKLDSWTKGGRISISSKQSIPQMRAQINAVSQFLNSNTSTISGIKRAISNTKNAIKQNFAREDKTQSVTDSEAEQFYEMLEDYKNINWLLKEYGASDTFTFLNAMRDVKADLDTFKDRFFKHFTKYSENDIDMQKKVEDLYIKYK